MVRGGIGKDSLGFDDTSIVHHHSDGLIAFVDDLLHCRIHCNLRTRTLGTKEEEMRRWRRRRGDDEEGDLEMRSRSREKWSRRR